MQVDASDVGASVHRVNGVRLHRLRGRLLPLVDLGKELGIDRVEVDDTLLLVVVRSSGRRLGLVVDAVGDPIEVVLKPLPRDVRAIAAFGGVAILGDGVPALVLDVAGVAATAGGREGALAEDEESDGPTGAIETGRSLLLAQAPKGENVAFRLADVRRLVQLPSGSVEHIGGFEVVQYDEAIVPIVRIGGDHPNDRAVLATVVCTSARGPVAVIVDRIADIVPEPAGTAPSLDDDTSSDRLVVGGCVTRLIDIDSLVPASWTAGAGATR